jgi:hypothetical protein
MLFASCAKEELTIETPPVQFGLVNWIGKNFLNKLAMRANWETEWRAIAREGHPALEGTAFAFGGEKGWHYIIPLLSGEEIVGMAIYPVESVEKDSLVTFGSLEDPVVFDTQGINDDIGARMFLRTPTFKDWEKKGWKLNIELETV